MASAAQLKEEGNRCFQAQEYPSADAFYSKAIIADAKNPVLYTNRAMARLKMRSWESVIADCETCLRLSPQNMKAFYYLSQAQLEMEDFDASLQNALQAHRLCAESADRAVSKSLAAVTGIVLRCKKARWDDRESRRIREGQDLEREVLGLIQRDTSEMLEGMGEHEVEGKRMIQEEGESKLAMMCQIFEKARGKDGIKREIPDWAIDEITFNVMVDPVMTKTGKSYERASILEHLRRNPKDPLTQEPLSPSELRPNIALRQACEEFLEKNGWAADW